MIYRAGIGQEVHGRANGGGATSRQTPGNPTLDLPCRKVFLSGQRMTEVVDRCWTTKPPRCMTASGAYDHLGHMTNNKGAAAWLQRPPLVTSDQNLTVTPP